jgi:hypothetical protein
MDELEEEFVVVVNKEAKLSEEEEVLLLLSVEGVRRFIDDGRIWSKSGDNDDALFIE